MTAPVIDMPRRVRVVDAQHAPPPDPLRGLHELRSVALVGAGALLSASSAPVEWWWHGIAQRTDVVELAGPAYAGKSTLAFLLEVAAANPTGAPVDLLGHAITPIERGKFAICVHVENSQRSASAKLVESCALLGLPERETLDRVVLVPRSSVTMLQEIDQLCRRSVVGLLVIDSRARVIRAANRDANSEDDQAAAAELLAGWARAAGSPVAVVSHLRKTTGPRGEPTLDDVSGSHQRVASADGVLLAWPERDANGAVVLTHVIVAKRRDDGGEEHPARMSFSIARADDGRKRLVIDGSARAADRPAHERVAELLAANGEQTKTQIREALNMNSATLERAIGVLFSERRLKKRVERVRGRKRELFAARAGTEALRGIVESSQSAKSELKK